MPEVTTALEVFAAPGIGQPPVVPSSGKSWHHSPHLTPNFQYLQAASCGKQDLHCSHCTAQSVVVWHDAAAFWPACPCRNESPPTQHPGDSGGEGGEGDGGGGGDGEGGPVLGYASRVAAVAAGTRARRWWIAVAISSTAIVVADHVCELICIASECQGHHVCEIGRAWSSDCRVDTQPAANDVHAEAVCFVTSNVTAGHVVPNVSWPKAAVVVRQFRLKEVHPA